MSVDFAHHKIFRAKVGKGGIRIFIMILFYSFRISVEGTQGFQRTSRTYVLEIFHVDTLQL